MLSRCLMIASVAALAVSGAAAAEPTKPAEKPAVQAAENRPAQVVLASADQLPTTVAVDQAQAVTPAKKPRAARVTTCRCAGQIGQKDQ